MRKLALSLAITLGFAAVLEVGARLLTSSDDAGVLVQRPIVKLYPGVPRAEEIFSEITPGMLDWAPYEHWAMQPHLRGRFFQTNSLGLRGKDIEPEKAPGRFRIAVLGGSAAWGLGSTSDEATVPARLEAILREQRPDRNIEVLNAAQIGYVSAQEFIYFQRNIRALQPDLVILLNGYNDVSADFINPIPGWPQNAAVLRARYEASWTPLPAQFDVAALLRKSRLLSALEGAWREARAAPPRTAAITPDETAAAYVANVSAIARLASPAPVVAALQPTLATTAKPLTEEERRIVQTKETHVHGYVERVRDTYQSMAVGLAQAGVPTILLDDALGNEPELLFADECHFADEGADRIARRIAEHVSGRL